MDYTPDTSLPLQAGDVVEGYGAFIDRHPETNPEVIQAILIQKIQVTGTDSFYLCSHGQSIGGTLLRDVKKIGIASVEYLLTHPNETLRNAGLDRVGHPIVPSDKIINLFPVKEE